MLRKILKIKNVGRFDDCKWRTGSQFESLTLLYGENGRGKSTFCDILRSCQTNTPDFILGRKMLGSTDACEVELRTDAANLSFKSNAWSAPLPTLVIFDSTFIHENIYVGDRIDHDQKKNLYRVIVGEKGVALAKKVDDLDVASREAGKVVAAKRAVLEAKLPKGTDIKTFIKLPADGELSAKTAVAETELKAAESAQTKAVLIQTKGKFQEITAPDSLETIEGLLVESLPGIAEGAEKTLRDHLANHTEKAPESWVSQGLGYQKDDSCPYCGQDTSRLGLVAAYRVFFDQAYISFKRRLTEAEKGISSKFSDKVALTHQKTTSENDALREFWRQLEVGNRFEFPDTSNFASVLTDVRNSASAVLMLKVAKPLESIGLTPELREALNALQNMRGLFDAYNLVVRQFNDEVAAFKAKQSGTDISKLKSALASLKLVELRYSNDVIKSIEEFIAAEKTKSQLEDQKKAAKLELDKHDEAILATHERRINELLAMFGASFRIGESERSDVGGKPSFNYKLRINNVVVDVGGEKTPISSPSFRNTLSAGDRSALALALFISQLERDVQLKDRIVVFDDPFTSQDRSRRTATQSIICGIAKRVNQVFVLSHDPHFLRSVWDGFKGGGNIKCFQFYRMANGTNVGEWDIEVETAGEYVKKHRVLWDYVHHANGTPRTVAQTIRPVLEEYLRLKLPQSFGDKEWLGDFISKIRNAPDTDPLASAKCILGDVELINEYSKRYHHSSNPSADTEIVDDTELTNFAKATLDVVGGF